MNRLENPTPKTPIIWEKGNWHLRPIRYILYIILAAIILFYLFQAVNAGNTLKNIKEYSPDANIYYLVDQSPALLTRLYIGDNIIKTDDIINRDIQSGDILVLGDELIGDNKKDSEMTLRLSSLINNGVGIVVYTDKILPKTWINLLEANYSIIKGSEDYPYYIHMDSNETIKYVKHETVSTNIPALNEAILYKEIIVKLIEVNIND